MSNPSTLAFDELPRGAGASGATEDIARALRESGIDAPSGLFDEALALARDGHLAPATERLRMLLVLDPADADAHLLLGKILASRGQFQEALSCLDAAVTHGAVLPPGLRDRVETGLHKQIRDAEEHRARVAARERGEIHQLRAEAKQLRSDNAGLELEVEELQRRVRLWSSATAVVAGVAAALLVASLLFGGDETEAVAEVQPSAEQVLVPSPETISGTAGAAATAAVAPTGAAASTSAATPSGTVEVSATTSPAKPATATATTTATTKAAASGSAKVHVVESGDTLGKLAQRYYGSSADWPRIQAANKDQLGDGTALKLGMKLKIPPAG